MARVDLAGVVGRYHNGGMIVPHKVSGNANQGGTAGAIGELLALVPRTRAFNLGGLQTDSVKDRTCSMKGES